VDAEASSPRFPGDNWKFRGLNQAPKFGICQRRVPKNRLGKQENLVRSGAGATCSLPLTTPNGTIGTLELGRLTCTPFSEEDVNLGSQIAIALENSLAYRELADMRDKMATEKLYLEKIGFDQNIGNMVGEEPGLPNASEKFPNRGAHGCHGADSRRNRERQGTGRARRSRMEQPPETNLREAQLRRYSNDVARK
jgi:hypothetical protein